MGNVSFVIFALYRFLKLSLRGFAKTSVIFPFFKQDFVSSGSRNERCDTVSNLISKGCPVDSVEYLSVRIVTPSENEINTQVTPGEVSIQLHPGLMIFKEICDDH